VQRVDKLLRAPDRKRGDDDRAAAFVGRVDDIFQLFLGVFKGFVQAVAVSAFHQQHIGMIDGFRVADDRNPDAAQVAGEDQPHVPPGIAILNIQHDNRAAEHVPRIQKGDVNARQNFALAVVTDGVEVFQAVDRVFDFVDRLDGGLAAFGAFFVDELRVFFLDMAAVQQHRRAQIARGERAQNIASEAAFDEIRDIAAVVDVSVTEHHRVNRLRLKR
jgi:hypothetical protein